MSVERTCTVCQYTGECVQFGTQLASKALGSTIFFSKAVCTFCRTALATMFNVNVTQGRPRNPQRFIPYRTEERSREADSSARTGSPAHGAISPAAHSPGPRAISPAAHSPGPRAVSPAAARQLGSPAAARQLGSPMARLGSSTWTAEAVEQRFEDLVTANAPGSAALAWLGKLAARCPALVEPGTVFMVAVAPDGHPPWRPDGGVLQLFDVAEVALVRGSVIQVVKLSPRAPRSRLSRAVRSFLGHFPCLHAAAADAAVAVVPPAGGARRGAGTSSGVDWSVGEFVNPAQPAGHSGSVSIAGSVAGGSAQPAGHSGSVSIAGSVAGGSGSPIVATLRVEVEEVGEVGTRAIGAVGSGPTEAVGSGGRFTTMVGPDGWPSMPMRDEDVVGAGGGGGGGGVGASFSGSTSSINVRGSISSGSYCAGSSLPASPNIQGYSTWTTRFDPDDEDWLSVDLEDPTAPTIVSSPGWKGVRFFPAFKAMIRAARYHVRRDQQTATPQT